MCGTDQQREQPQIGDRGSNPGSGIQSVLIFFIGSTCSGSLSFIVNIYYFTWLTSFDFDFVLI